MNPGQLAQQIKHTLAQLTWPGGSGDVVFGSRSVYVYAGLPPTAAQTPPQFPFALVAIDSGTPDENDPELLLQTFSVATVVEVVGDPMGEFAVIGGSRKDIGRSAGAGIVEVGERVRSAISKLTGADGAPLVVSASGIAAPSPLGGGRHIVADEFSVQALCTSEAGYDAPQRLAVSGDDWTWAGTWCEERYDFLQYRMGWVAGSTPAASAADLDAVIYSGADAFTTAGPQTGRVYHVFADYARRGSTEVAATSPVVRGTYLTL